MNFKLVFRVMKLIAFLMLVGWLQVSAAGFGQGITLSEKNAPLEKVFSEIRKQAGVTFAYLESTLTNAKKVSINIKNGTIEQVLDSCLKNQKLSYIIIDKTVVIREDDEPSGSITAIPPVIIKGVVVNEKKEPVPGVSVSVKGTNIATATNDKGEFEISNIPDDATLVFTGTNIETFETKINGRSFLSLTASTKISQNEDIKIITTGFQNIEKRKLIGDISVVSGDDLQDMPLTGSFEKSLSGRVAGVYIRSNSGRPGESGTVQIRGINTLTGNREPLWILDGMPLPTGEVSSSVNELLTRGLGNIPPEDIESITILKDATASAIYGSRAANGVIVITTKQGNAGKDYLNYSGRYSVSEMPRNKFNFMTTAEKINFERSLFSDFKDAYGGRVVGILNSVEKGNITEAEGENQIALLSNTNTDWMKVIMQNASTQSHVLSLSGGSTKTQYYTSLYYQNSNGVMRTNKYENAGFNMKLSNYVRKNLLIRFNLYSTLKRNKEGQSVVDPFTYASFANPYEKPYNDDGTYAADMSYRNLANDITYYSDLNYKDFNIIKELKENTLKTAYGNIRGQFGVEYKFLKYFHYVGTGVVDYTSVHNTDESMAGTYRSWVNNWLNKASTQNGMVLPEYNQGFLSESMGRVMDYTVRNSIEFNKNFGSRNFVQIFGANEFGGRTNYQFNHFNPIYLEQFRVAGYPSWNYVTPGAYTRLDLTKFGGTDFAEDRSVSFIGSAVYSYDNRYVFNGNIRTDGVDIIGTKNQFAPLWSAGLRWNAHNEKFLKPYSNVISRLVLSAGFGYRGSINRSG